MVLACNTVFAIDFTNPIQKSSYDSSSTQSKITVIKLSSAEINQLLLKRNKKYLAYLITDKFIPKSLKIYPAQISSFSFIRKINVLGYGLSSLFSGELNGDLPEVIYKHFYILINEKKENGIILFLNDLHLVKAKTNSFAGLISGNYKIKSKAYFLIFDYSKEEHLFKIVLNTELDSWCGNGIPVENQSNDCISYKGFKLTFKNIDLNNDGLLDIEFHGTVLEFCEKLETNQGRLDVKPKKIVGVDFRFIAQNKMGGVTWRLIDKSSCKIIN